MLSKWDPTSNVGHTVTEARTKAGGGHPAETRVSHENLRPDNSMNISGEEGLRGERCPGSTGRADPHP